MKKLIAVVLMSFSLIDGYAHNECLIMVMNWRLDGPACHGGLIVMRIPCISFDIRR